MKNVKNQEVRHIKRGTLSKQLFMFYYSLAVHVFLFLSLLFLHHTVSAKNTHTLSANPPKTITTLIQFQVPLNTLDLITLTYHFLPLYFPRVLSLSSLPFSQ